MAALLIRVARFCARRRRIVLAAWVIAAVGLTVLVEVVDAEARSELRVPGADSQIALDLLAERFPAFAGTSAQVVFHDIDGVAQHQTAIGDVLGDVAELEHVTLVADPFVDGPVSPDGTTAVATVRYAQGQADLPGETYRLLNDTVEQIEADGLRVETGGALGFFDDQSTGSAEQIGFVAAVIILLVAFGSVIAMGLPIVAAVVGLGVGLSLVRLVASVADVPETALTLVTMIGIGVGIDYALFIVTRYREVLERYRWDENAIAVAAATAGKAVVYAGGTVVVSILGLAIAGIPFVGWMGLAAAMVVLVMVAVAATLIPAMLGFAGHGIDRFSLPWRRRGAALDGWWARWGRRIVRRPWPWFLFGVGALVVLSLPLFSMRLGQSDAGNLPESSAHRQAYDLIETHLGAGANGPLLVAVDAGDPAALATVDMAAEAIADLDGVAAVGEPVGSPDEDAAVFTVIPATGPETAETEALVATLRTDVLPSAFDGLDATAYVAGTTANFIDLADRVGERLPWLIATIVVASFVLLVVMFRSVVVPLKAALVNLLSIGAAYGVVVAVFQWGWGLGLVGLDDTVPITSVIPMIMFAVLFGLSMDYEVFLLSRIREEYDETGDPDESVVVGLAATGRIITSAAAIMVAVFYGFVLSDDPLIKMAGVGLGTAILVDATIVRLMVVPATMRLFGHRNWWAPAWLHRRGQSNC